MLRVYMAVQEQSDAVVVDQIANGLERRRHGGCMRDGVKKCFTALGAPFSGAKRGSQRADRSSVHW